MTKFPTWAAAEAQAVIADFAARPGALLPILHALQDRFGYVDRAIVPALAEALNLSRAEVLGVISFYHEFRDQPPAGRVIKLCRAEACQAAGSEALVDHVESALGAKVDAVPRHGQAAIETVYCLGNCALGPAALVDGEPVGRLDAERLTALCAGAPL